MMSNSKKQYRYRLFLYPFLFFIIVLAIIFRNNASVLYGNLGNYYFKKNNSEKAQFYYEKAFLLNNNNYKIRENYVNSIINSPLTISAQEKLVNIAEDKINDNASLNAKYFLYNLKREIHNKYPLNYIQQAAYNQKILHWGKLPITYEFKNTSGVPEEIVESVNDAFNEWERASSCRIRFNQVKLNADIKVEFISEDIDKLKLGEKYVIAYTTPEIYQNNLQNMIIKFNIKDLEGKIYSPNQMYNTALHEIMHALGFMGHSYDKNNIMHMSKDNSAIEQDSRVRLTEADKSTLDLLYKIKPDITNANELKYLYIPYLVLGNIDDVNFSKQKEAKNYISKAPTLAGGYIDMAESLVAQKKYNQAVKYLEYALKYAKTNEAKYVVYYNLAVAYFYDNVCEIAEDYINLAKEIKDNDELHLLSAEMYVKQNDLNNAIKEYKYLAEKNPNNIDYTISLVNIYIQKRSYLEARKFLKKFIKNNPQEKNNPRFNSYGILRL